MLFDLLTRYAIADDPENMQEFPAVCGETFEIEVKGALYRVSLVTRVDHFIDLVIESPNMAHGYIMPVGLRGELFASEEAIARSVVAAIHPDRAMSPHWKHEDWWTLDIESEG